MKNTHCRINTVCSAAGLSLRIPTPATPKIAPKSPSMSFAVRPLNTVPKKKKGIEPVIGKSTTKTMQTDEKIRKPARIRSGSGQAVLEVKEGWIAGSGRGDSEVSIGGGVAAREFDAAKAATTGGRVNSASHQIPIPSGMP